MPGHEKKQCPRCLSEFECKTGSVLLCQCSKISLTAEQLEYCNSQYEECLCIDCLYELRSEFNVLSFRQKMKAHLAGHS